MSTSAASSVSSAQPGALAQQIDIAVLKKQQDAAKAQGGKLEVKRTPEVEAAKNALLAKLTELNAKGDVVSADEVTADPTLSLASQVGQMLTYNEQLVTASIGVSAEPTLAEKIVPKMEWLFSSLG